MVCSISGGEKSSNVASGIQKCMNNLLGQQPIALLHRGHVCHMYAIGFLVKIQITTLYNEVLNTPLFVQTIAWFIRETQTLRTVKVHGHFRLNTFKTHFGIVRNTIAVHTLYIKRTLEQTTDLM